MKNLLKFAFAFMLVFSSCSKDNEAVTPADQTQEQGISNSLRSSLRSYATTTSSSANAPGDYLIISPCHGLNFPFKMKDLDGNEVTINNEEDFINGINLFEFVYPIEATKLEDDSQVTLNSDEELFDASCMGDIDPQDDPQDDPQVDPCFEIVFPMSFILEDGSTVSVNNEQEFNELILSPQGATIVNIGYPINVKLADGTEQAINSEDEMIALFDSCM